MALSIECPDAQPVRFHPTLIAGINNLSGNKPPWMLPAKARYLPIDTKRATERVGLHGLATPKDFMAMSLTISPLRALHYIKANYPKSVFLAAFEYMFRRQWMPPHSNLTKDDVLASVLADATDAKGTKLFTSDDVAAIMKGRDGMKAAVKDATQKAVDLGAFGAPWFWVTNAQGEGQPFFGSDRFNHIYRHLGIPFQDITILPPSKL